MVKMKFRQILATALAMLQIFALGSLASADEKAAAEVAVAIPFEISPTGHQIVTLMYDEKPIRLILDTAAGANVISEKAAGKFNLKLMESGQKAAGLGTSGHAVEYVDPITVTAGTTKLRLQDLISLDLSHVEAAGEPAGIDGLLGSPFFRKYKAKIDFQEKQVIIRTSRK
jgi:hypothetical protein